MKVLLACPYDWNAPGGVQSHVRGLAAALLERGHEVRVLAPGRGRARETWVRFVSLPYSISYAGTVAPIGVGPYSVRAIRRQIGAFSPDVVHVHEPFTPSTSMYTALSASGTPVVATFHAYLNRSRLLAVAAPVLRPVAKRIARSIAVSSAAAAFASGPLGYLPTIIPNGVDTKAFAEAGTVAPSGLPDGRVVLWVNRLDPQKGFSVALGAFGRMARANDDLTLVVAGDGPERDLERALPSELRDRIVMLGNVPHDTLPGYFAAADAFISPATGQESFGIVLIEAMAAGAPVVASDIPGYREVVTSGENGLLVPSGSAEALADAVGAVLADPKLSKRLTGMGRTRAAEFDWGVVAGRIESVYQDAIAR